MRILYIFLLSIKFALALSKRDNSIMSNLVRLVLTRSKFNKTNNEGSRVTQAPIIKMNLEKTKMPLFLYHTHKQPQDEIRLQRANELDNSNSKDDDLQKVNGKLEEMEIFQVIPLKMFKAHHYTEDELKKMNDNAESRETYEYLFVESPKSQQASS